MRVISSPLRHLAVAASASDRATSAGPTSPGVPAADPGRRTRRATPPDSLDSAAAALALTALGGPPRAPTAPNNADALAPGDAPGASIASLLTPPLAILHDGAAARGRKTAPPHLPEAGLDAMTAATLRAAYGLPARTAPARSAAPLAAIEDSPVAAWIAAAIGRAISRLGATAARAVPVAQPQVDAAAPSMAAAPDPTAAPLPGIAAALTPLERAVHDLIGRLDAVESPRGPPAR